MRIISGLLGILLLALICLPVPISADSDVIKVSDTTDYKVSKDTQTGSIVFEKKKVGSKDSPDIPLEYQPKSQEIKEAFEAKGISASKVHLSKDYSSTNFYTQVYKDIDSETYIASISSLPMVDFNGASIESRWTLQGSEYKSKNNVFSATVKKTGETFLALKNDQPNGKKAIDSLTYKPSLYLGGIEQKSKGPVLLGIDPYNSNYSENIIEWDYNGTIKRRMRLIEGSLLGSWVFLASPGADIRIAYNQKGNLKLNLGKFASDSDTEFVPKSVFDIVTYPFEISDTVSFYPDAHPETTSVDGTVEFRGPGSLTWANIVGQAGNSADSTTNTLRISPICSAVLNEFNTQTRSILLFDTSSLVGSSVTSARIYLWKIFGSNAFGATPAINIYSSTPASNTSLIGTDYSQVGIVPFCDTALTYANFVAGYNGFTLNAAGLAAIDTTGVSKFGIRESNYDVANTSPPWSSGGYTYSFQVASSEFGLGYMPQLLVNYTPAPPVFPGWTAHTLLESRSNTQVKTGTYSAKLSPIGASGGYFDQSYSNFASLIGSTTTFGSWVYASNPASVYLGLTDGVLITYSSFHSGLAGWEWLTTSLTLSAGATSLRSIVIVDPSITAYIDGASLVVSSSITPTITSSISTVSLGGLGVIDNDWPWLLGQSNSMPYLNYFKVNHPGGPIQTCWLQPVNIISGATIPDRSGWSNSGRIVWGVNPVTLVVSVGGLNPVSSYTLSGGSSTSTPVPALPTPMPTLVAPYNPDMASQPQYPAVHSAAVSLDWNDQTMYGLIWIIAAIGMGFAVMVSIGTIWGFIGGFGITLAAGASTLAIDWWFILIGILAMAFIAFLFRRM